MGAILAKQERVRQEYDFSRDRAQNVLETCKPEYVTDPELLGLLSTHGQGEPPFEPHDDANLENEDDDEDEEDEDERNKAEAIGMAAFRKRLHDGMLRDNIALLDAAAKGQYYALQQLLVKQHVNVNFNDKYRRSPIYMAAERGFPQCIEKLHSMKGDINIRNQDGWTPLHAAVFHGQVKAMEMCLMLGADVCAREDIMGCTPLIMAVSSPKLFLVDLVSWEDRKKRKQIRLKAYKKSLNATPDIETHRDPYKRYLRDPNSIEVLVMDKLLSRYGMNVDDYDKLKRTALIYACRYGRENAVSRLLAAKAEPHWCDKDGRTTLFHAATNGHLEVVRMLMDVNVNVNKTDQFFVSALHGALAQCDEAMVNLLLNAQADVNQYDCDGMTPVMIAMDKSSRRPFAELVKRGANLNVLDRRGYNVVIYSIQTGMFADVLEVLLRIGSKVKDLLEYQDPQGKCALHHGVGVANAENAVRIVTQLCMLHYEAAALGDCNWNTPVHVACELGRLEALRIMVERLPSAEMRNKRGETPLHHAAHGGHLHCVLALLHDKGDGPLSDASAVDMDGKTLLMHACCSGHLDLVNLLLVNREGTHTELAITAFNINATAKDGSTAIIVAAREGHWQLLPSLVLGGANIAAKDFDGFSALHWAAVEDEGLVAKCLLDLGFDIDATDGKGWTPLMHAVDRGCDDVARVLVDCKAGLDSRNFDGDTALQICLKRTDAAAENTKHILLDTVMDRGSELAQACPAQGCFMVSVLDANGLTLEGHGVDINPYVCVQFCSQRDLRPQISYTSCAIHNHSPEWFEVFRFDTEMIDPSAYLVAWVLAAPGIDEDEIVEATALGVSHLELRHIKAQGIDTTVFKKQPYQERFENMLEFVRKRADYLEDEEVGMLRQIQDAKDSGVEATEDVKAAAGANQLGDSLEDRRWQDLKNFRAVMSENGCDIPKPLVPKSHLPIGCVVVRFRMLRQAVWGTEPVIINRAVRLARSGSMRIEIDFRPRYFMALNPSPDLPMDEEEQLMSIEYKDDEMDPEIELELDRMANKGRYREMAPLLPEGGDGGLNHRAQLKKNNVMLYNRFMQIAWYSRKFMESQEAFDHEKKATNRAHSDMLTRVYDVFTAYRKRKRKKASEKEVKMEKNAMDQPIVEIEPKKLEVRNAPAQQAMKDKELPQFALFENLDTDPVLWGLVSESRIA